MNLLIIVYTDNCNLNVIIIEESNLPKPFLIFEDEEEFYKFTIGKDYSPHFINLDLLGETHEN